MNYRSNFFRNLPVRKWNENESFVIIHYPSDPKKCFIKTVLVRLLKKFFWVSPMSHPIIHAFDASDITFILIEWMSFKETFVTSNKLQHLLSLPTLHGYSRQHTQFMVNRHTIQKMNLSSGNPVYSFGILKYHKL